MNADKAFSNGFMEWIIKKKILSNVTGLNIIIIFQKVCLI